MQKRHYSVKLTGFLVLLVPGLYKIHLIMWTLACLSHKIVWHCSFIYQLDIIITVVCIVLASGLAFLTSVQSGRAWEHNFVVSMHCHAYQKYTRSLRSRITSLPGHFRWHQWCLHHKRFHCTIIFCMTY